MLRPACAYAQSDQSLCQLLDYAMTLRPLTEHHLEFQSLKVGCTCSSESTFVKMPHCWKSHVVAQLCLTLIPQSTVLKVSNYLVPHILLWHRIRIIIHSAVAVHITCQLITNITNNYTSRYLCSSDSRTRVSVRGTTMRSRSPHNDSHGMEQNIVQGSSCSFSGGVQVIHHARF